MTTGDIQVLREILNRVEADIKEIQIASLKASEMVSKALTEVRKEIQDNKNENDKRWSRLYGIGAAVMGLIGVEVTIALYIISQ